MSRPQSVPHFYIMHQVNTMKSSKQQKTEEEKKIEIEEREHQIGSQARNGPEIPGASSQTHLRWPSQSLDEISGPSKSSDVLPI